MCHTCHPPISDINGIFSESFKTVFRPNEFLLFVQVFSTTLPQQLLFQRDPQLSHILTSPLPPKISCLRASMISLQLTTQRIHLTVSAIALSPLSVPVGFRKLNHWSQRTPAKWWPWLFRHFPDLAFSTVCAA